MFTGIVQEIGTVASVAATAGGGRRLTIRAPLLAPGLSGGESVAVNGVCVTVRDERGVSGEPSFAADILGRTWEITNVRRLAPGDLVNLERALRAGDAVGGHFVLGHVDGTGVVVSRERRGADTVLGIRTGEEFARGLVPSGSVAVDGVSLTVAAIAAGRVEVHLIPTTLSATTLGGRRPGDVVNLEADVLGKHASPRGGGTITEEFLRSRGF